jgi:uncharacterized membrane protein
MDIVLVLAGWLHIVAFVIAWGYYGILGRFVLPGLARTSDVRQQAADLFEIERRALPFLLISLVLFGITGGYLLLVDPSYAGLGNVTASSWAALMLVKHAVVVVFIVVAVVIDFWARGVDESQTDQQLAATLRRVRLTSDVATGLGALIALLTVAAQQA